MEFRTSDVSLMYAQKGRRTISKYAQTIRYPSAGLRNGSNLEFCRSVPRPSPEPYLRGTSVFADEIPFWSGGGGVGCGPVTGGRRTDTSPKFRRLLITAAIISSADAFDVPFYNLLGEIGRVIQDRYRFWNLTVLLTSVQNRCANSKKNKNAS